MYFVYTHDMEGYYVVFALHLENVNKRETLYTNVQILVYLTGEKN